MNLDSSFTLISSLTPRGKLGHQPVNKYNKLSSKLKKRKEKATTNDPTHYSQRAKSLCEPNERNKENLETPGENLKKKKGDFQSRVNTILNDKSDVDILISDKSSDFVDSPTSEINNCLTIESNLNETRKSVCRSSDTENPSLSSADDSGSSTYVAQKQISNVIVETAESGDSCECDGRTSRVSSSSSSYFKLDFFGDNKSVISLTSDFKNMCSVNSNAEQENYQLNKCFKHKETDFKYLSRTKDCAETNVIFNSKSIDNEIKKYTSNDINDIQKGKDDTSQTNVQTVSDTSICLVDLPTEEIPKFEHITYWLEGTRENSITVLSSESSFNSPKPIVKKKRTKKKSKVKESLSPRLIQKLEESRTKVDEEQKKFEELFGREVLKRLSDELEEKVYLESSQESANEKMFILTQGMDCRRDQINPQSEPKKGRLKKSAGITAPLTERRKHNSISSSSSEDRFEEFLNSLQRGKVKRNADDRPDTPDFINDSDSDCDTSLTTYQNFLSSAVKDEHDQLSASKLNRRRLSFGSSQGDCESVKSDTTSKGKICKTTTKINNKDITKLRVKDGVQLTDDRSVDDTTFTLVTPLRIKTKNKQAEKTLPDSDSNTGTSTHKLKTNEDFKVKNLNDNCFKVPKQLSSLKTPNIQLNRTPLAPATMSFLASLSGNCVSALPIHPDTFVYKTNFKVNKEALTKRLFSMYNKEVFHNQLPEDMVIEWSSRMRSTSGFCYNSRVYKNSQMFHSSRLVLSNKIIDRTDRLRDTLIHEMCHAATWIINASNDGHGPKWKAWAAKANQRFPELPHIKICHNYSVNTKYTYKCVSCSHSIGRHSKSLNLDRKCCGYCRGRFEVFLTSQLSNTNTKCNTESTKKQRAPNAFAVFVKENYATVKQENKVAHGEIMKLLSQKFAQIKV